MNLLEIKKVGNPRKRAIRIGRGSGSGKGKTAGKGHKGQNCRSGVTLPRIFEGGTMPLYRRIPKRGFNNKKFQDFWILINIDDLNKIKEGDKVSIDSLKKANIISVPKSQKRVKIKLLGSGELKVKKLKVKVNKISKSAQEQLEKNECSVELIKIKTKAKRSPRRKSS